MTRGQLWKEMEAQSRCLVSDLERSKIPVDPGVYSFFREGEPIYVGKAGSLQPRVGRHCGKGKSMRGSAFRRNVADHLGIATANDIYKARYQPDTEELEKIRGFIEECEVAWITRPTEPEAVQLETDLKSEWMPPLTRV